MFFKCLQDNRGEVYWLRSLCDCPTEAIRLIRKETQMIVSPPKNEDAWFEERGRQRKPTIWRPIY
jgi:hypothetical protein